VHLDIEKFVKYGSIANIKVGDSIHKVQQIFGSPDQELINGLVRYGNLFFEPPFGRIFRIQFIFEREAENENGICISNQSNNCRTNRFDYSFGVFTADATVDKILPFLSGFEPAKLISGENLFILNNPNTMVDLVFQSKKAGVPPTLFGIVAYKVIDDKDIPEVKRE